MKLDNYKYILASKSPRRKELLTQAGIDFICIPSTDDESHTEEKPYKIVKALAQGKAKNVYERLSDHQTDMSADIENDNIVIIGADTIVCYQDEILGKPADEADAFAMLSMLSDRKHEVYTGVSLYIIKDRKLKIHTFYEKTDVTFYDIRREDIKSYIETGDPMDKAGAYGIQGPFAIHIKKISGDYNNVVGLPIARLYQELLKTL